MINFNVSPYIGVEDKYVAEAINSKKLCGDGPFTKKCEELMQKKFSAKKVLLTTSGTDALELAALLCNLQPNDEIILPSFTFSSTANCFALRGSKLVFVDIEKDTMNIDVECIKKAITNKTKVICVVHYAGVAVDMDAVMKIAKENNIIVIEDAAHGVMAKYKGRYLGTIADIGCYSFHETKNYSMGEGGAIIINNPIFIERAEILREKGTDRSKFLRGQIDKYTWVDFGSSFLPSELNAAYLYGQLLSAEKINENRLSSWNYYNELLSDLKESGKIETPFIPSFSEHNAHMYYIKVKDLEERTSIQTYLRDNGIQTAFHYIPLHSAPAGLKFGVFIGADLYTTIESERLFRLPMYYGLTKTDIEKVCYYIHKYFEES